MAEAAEEKPCSNPGCNQPDTKSCSACKTSAYCGVSCQTADWPRHKEECDGHLRKVGRVNLAKAMGFFNQQNWLQALRDAEIAATKLKQLKDRRLETVQLISDAFICKFDCYGRMDRHIESMECIKECCTLWAMNHLRNPGSMRAALALIQSCIHNGEFEDAERYARHAYFMIAEMTDNFIPSDQQPWFRAEASYYLAASIHYLARAGGIPPEEKQKAGEEAIAHARKALELKTHLHGIQNARVANNMGALADILDYFNDVDNDETLRLVEQAIAIYRQVEGSLSMNLACCENRLAIVYDSRARRAKDTNDLDRYMTYLELALPHYREALRISTAINHVDTAAKYLQNISIAKEELRIARAAAATRG